MDGARLRRRDRYSRAATAAITTAPPTPPATAAIREASPEEPRGPPLMGRKGALLPWSVNTDCAGGRGRRQ